MLQRLKEFAAALNDCDNCGTLPSDTSQWDAAQNAWASDWLNYVQFGGTRPPRKPPL